MVTNTAAELVRRAYDGRRALVRYEDLVAGPRETLVRLATW
jgi:hypothetical protein